MSDVFHEGERSVQERAGAADMARKVGGGIHAEIRESSQRFLAAQRWVFLGAADGDGHLWATSLVGAPGFAHVLDERTLELRSSLRRGDPLHGALRAGTAVGLLAIEFATRRRMRLNGSVLEANERVIRVRSEQVYGNCPKYIQSRELSGVGQVEGEVGEPSRSAELTPAQRTRIAGADTFVIATQHAAGGADVSHRGGSPGFVRVLDARTLLWPDYSGNTMFQTLGNLAVDPRAGLLFIDFETGDTLHLTGEARILWDDSRQTEFAGAERLVRFDVAAIVERANVLPTGWHFLEPSPHNPR